MADRNIKKYLISLAIYTSLLFTFTLFLSYLIGNYTIGFISMSVTFLLFAVVLIPFKRTGKIIIYSSIFIIFILLYAIYYKNILASFSNVFNRFADISNENVDFGIEHFYFDYHETWFSNVYAVTLMLSISSLINVITLTKSKIIFFVFNVTLMLVLFICGIKSHYLYTFMIILLAFISLGSNGFKDFDFGKIGTVSLICSISFIMILLPNLIYKKSMGIEDFKYDFTNKVDEILYDGKYEIEGNLNRANVSETSDLRMLTVSKNQSIQTLYLKGYVGANFSNNRWDYLSNSTYANDENASIMKYLKSYNFPYTQQSQYDKLNGNDYSFNINISIDNASKKRYYYPYYLTSMITNNTFHESELRKNLSSSNNYSLTVSRTDASSEAIVQASWLTDGTQTTEQSRYVGVNGNYQYFVYNNYLDINDTLSEKIKTNIKVTNNISVYSVTTVIRDYYENNYNYRVGNELSDIKTNFLDDFYNNEIINGNCSYFATAAVYAYRAYGIPARYVEGYLYKNKASTTTSYEELTGKNQHAWVEVYFDGIGWLPIEVTPSYYSGSTGNGGPGGSGGGNNSNGNNGNQEKPPITNDPSNDSDTSVDGGGFILFTPANRYKTLFYCSLTALFVVSIWFILYFRREIIRKNMYMMLNTLQGEDYCRYIFTKFSKIKTRLNSPMDIDTETRIKNILDKGIYGGYELDYNEKYYLNYNLYFYSCELMKNKNIFLKFYYKYILDITFDEWENC